MKREKYLKTGIGREFIKALIQKNIAVRLISAAADKGSSPVPATKAKLQRNLELCLVYILFCSRAGHSSQLGDYQ